MTVNFQFVWNADSSINIKNEGFKKGPWKLVKKENFYDFPVCDDVHVCVQFVCSCDGCCCPLSKKCVLHRVQGKETMKLIIYSVSVCFMLYFLSDIIQSFILESTTTLTSWGHLITFCVFWMQVELLNTWVDSVTENLEFIEAKWWGKGD